MTATEASIPSRTFLRMSIVFSAWVTMMILRMCSSEIARATVPEFLEDYIEDIVLAKRLREVLALRGFRRITPEQPNADDDRFKGYHLSGDCVPLSDVELNWLPAIEMLGEGLFIKIREDALEEWEDAFENEYQPMRTRLEHSNVGCENFFPPGMYCCTRFLIC